VAILTQSVYTYNLPLAVYRRFECLIPLGTGVCLTFISSTHQPTELPITDLGKYGTDPKSLENILPLKFKNKYG
jgi:hypothetical protein